MEKMPVAQQTEIRKNVYGLIVDTLNQSGFTTEPVKGGVLVDLGEGYFGTVSFSVHDATKFDVETVRALYQESLEKKAEKAAKAAAKQSKAKTKTEDAE